MTTKFAREWALQERTTRTAWRTESTYPTQSEAIAALERIRFGEPTNADGEPMRYRIIERTTVRKVSP